MDEQQNKPQSEKKTVEVKYEIQLGQLTAIVIIGILIAIGAGFFVGKAVGAVAVDVEKPDYCTADVSGGKVVVSCNELGNVSLDSLCQWASPELREKVKLVLITEN